MTVTAIRTRQPKGVSTGGQFAAEHRPEASLALGLSAPQGQTEEGDEAIEVNLDAHVRQSISEIVDTVISCEDPRLTQDGILDSDAVDEVLSTLRDEGKLMARGEYGTYRVLETPRAPMPGTALDGAAAAEQVVAEHLQVGRRVRLQVYRTKTGHESDRAINLHGHVCYSGGTGATVALDEGQQTHTGYDEVDLELDTGAFAVRGLSIEGEEAIWLDAIDPHESEEIPFRMRITTPPAPPSDGPSGRRGPWVREDGAESPFDLTPIEMIYRDPRGHEYDVLIPGAEITYRRIVTDPTGNMIGHLDSYNGGTTWTAALGAPHDLEAQVEEGLDELAAAEWVHARSGIGGGWSVPNMDQSPLF